MNRHCPPCDAEIVTPAERARRYRRRQRDGIQVVPVEVDQVTVEALVRMGRLDRNSVGDPLAIGEALVAVARDTGC